MLDLKYTNMVGWKNVYLYVIGINKFENLSTLSCCENDANLFFEALNKKFEDAKSRLLLTSCQNDIPTSSKIKELLHEIESLELNENDIIFFYFAGHGFTSKGHDYLTCHDTDLERLDETSIKTEDVISSLNLSRAGTSVLIIDACRNAIGRTVEGSFFSKNTADFARRNGVISFFSCSPGEYSQELLHLGKGHGIFIYSFVESLNNGQNYTPLELDKAISYHVDNIIKQNNLSKQRPYTVVAPLQKAILDIINNKIITVNLSQKRNCILIVGPTNAGKTTLGQYIANHSGYVHAEMSTYVFKRYAKKTSYYDGSLQDFLEDEVWSNNDNDIIAQDLLMDNPGGQDLVICGPRKPEEIETLLSQDWNIKPIFLFSDTDTRYTRYQTDKNNFRFRYDLNYKEFIRKDMRELDWGLAKIATMQQLEIVTNESKIDELFKYIDKKYIKK